MCAGAGNAQYRLALSLGVCLRPNNSWSTTRALSRRCFGSLAGGARKSLLCPDKLKKCARSMLAVAPPVVCQVHNMHEFSFSHVDHPLSSRIPPTNMFCLFCTGLLQAPAVNVIQGPIRFFGGDDDDEDEFAVGLGAHPPSGTTPATAPAPQYSITTKSMFGSDDAAGFPSAAATEPKVCTTIPFAGKDNGDASWFDMVRSRTRADIEVEAMEVAINEIGWTQCEQVSRLCKLN